MVHFMQSEDPKFRTVVKLVHLNAFSSAFPEDNCKKIPHMLCLCPCETGQKRDYGAVSLIFTKPLEHTDPVYLQMPLMDYNHKLYGKLFLFLLQLIKLTRN